MLTAYFIFTLGFLNFVMICLRCVLKAYSRCNYFKQMQQNVADLLELEDRELHLK